ncbi:MAG TPA: substrate-binding domain-containing protein [Conexibacter sp.]|nr:substrate-binding domain-containing protein [Conexibacter sp.]
MRVRNTRYGSVMRALMALALVLVAALVAACGDEKAADKTAPADTAQTTSDNGSACAADGAKLAFVLHIRIPFTQQIADGGQAAADDCGADYKVTGPPSAADPPAAIQAFQTVVQTGAKGVAVIPFPTTDLWRRPVEDAQGQGVKIALSQVSGDLGAPVVTGNDKDMGRQMAETAIDEIGADATGSAVVATCAAGVSVLDDRVAGIKEAFAEKAPGVKVVGPLDSGQPAPQNYSNWSAIVQKNADALAFLGPCAFDAYNLAKVKRQTGKDFTIVGVDLEPESLKAIEDGTVLAVLNGNPYLQGYIPIRLLANAVANDTEQSAGWIDPGLEVVKKGAAGEWLARLKDPAAVAAFYKPQVDRLFADIDGAIQPLENQAK